MNTIVETHYNVDDELSLRDLIQFFAASWISILIAGAAGLALALAYIFIAPPVYESKLQIEMARTNGSNTGPSTEVRGVPIEESQLLVERLRLPSTYSQDVARTCAAENAPLSGDQLTRRVTARAVKNVNSVVEITVQGGSPQRAQACAESVFEMVRAQQNQLLLPLLQETRQDIESMQARLNANQEFLSSMDKTSVQSAVYLAKRDESMWLLDQISLLERSLRQTTETRLVSPIYASDKQVSPRKAIALVAGLLGGLMLGVLWAFMRNQLARPNQ